jgi:hypothetical protein
VLVDVRERDGSGTFPVDQVPIPRQQSSLVYEESVPGPTRDETVAAGREDGASLADVERVVVGTEPDEGMVAPGSHSVPLPIPIAPPAKSMRRPPECDRSSGDDCPDRIRARPHIGFSNIDANDDVLQDERTPSGVCGMWQPSPIRYADRRGGSRP